MTKYSTLYQGRGRCQDQRQQWRQERPRGALLQVHQDPGGQQERTAGEDPQEACEEANQGNQLILFWL